MNITESYTYLTRARRDLWRVLDSVPNEALSRPLLPGDRFRCIKDLVFHIADVEDGWLRIDILQETPVQHSFPSLQGKEFFDDVPLGDLLAYWQAVEARTLADLPRLTADPQRRIAPDDWHGVSFSVDGLLWHVLLHAVRHTAQIATLLRLQNIKPPQLDLLFYLLPPEAKAFTDAHRQGEEP